MWGLLGRPVKLWTDGDLKMVLPAQACSMLCLMQLRS